MLLPFDARDSNVHHHPKLLQKAGKQTISSDINYSRLDHMIVAHYDFNTMKFLCHDRQLTQTARAAQTHHPVKKRHILFSRWKAQMTVALQLINFLVISVLREAHLHISDWNGTVDGEE